MCRRAQALALQRMLEEDFYFCALYCMYEADDYYFKVEAPRVLSDLPGLIYPAAIRVVRSTIRRYLYGQVRLCTATFLHSRPLRLGS
jgi:hypothetical protein